MQSQARGFAIVERANTGLQATLLRLRSASHLNPTVSRCEVLVDKRQSSGTPNSE
jgi:hypothetical protein